MTENNKDASLSLPQRPQINEQVAVIGSGIAGSVNAWMLSEAGYNVTLFEQSPKAFDGTSIGPVVVHLGGRYTSSPTTASECLRSGIQVKRVMPFAVKEEGGRLNYLVPDPDGIDHDYHANYVPLGDFVASYDDLQRQYRSLPQEDRVYGDPDAFYRRMEPSELAPYGAIVGGIKTQEQTYDMQKARKVLLDTLAARGVDIRTSTQVTALQKQGKGYRITHKNINDGSTETEPFDTVVNAAGYGARSLSQDFGDLSKVNLQLKLFSNVSVDQATQTTYPDPFFVTPGFMHWVPQGKRGSSVSGFYSEILDNIYVLQGERLVVPPNWEEILRHGVPVDYEGRTSAIVEQAQKYFMPELNESARPTEMYPGVAVSFQPDRTNKTQKKPGVIGQYPGFYTVIPSKAANAVPLGLDIVNMMLDESQRNGTATDKSEYVEGVRSGRNIAFINS